MILSAPSIRKSQKQQQPGQSRQIERLPPRSNWLQGRYRRGDHQDRRKVHHKPHPTYVGRQQFQIGVPVLDPSTIHSHHRGGGKTRGHEHQAAVCQHRGDNFRLEGDSRNQR